MEGVGIWSADTVTWGLLALLLGTWAAGARVIVLWRRSAASELRSAERARLLIESARELEAIDDPRAVLGILPELAHRLMRVRTATVLVAGTDGLRPMVARDGRSAELAADRPTTSTALRVAPAAHVLSRTYGRSRRGPRRPDDSTRGRSLAGFPIVVNATLVAVLEFERDATDPFDPTDHDTLQAFARLVEDRLQWLGTVTSLRAQQREWELVARLQTRLQPVEALEDAALTALATLIDALDLDAGLAVTLQNDRFRSVARRGVVPAAIVTALADGLPTDSGYIAEAWERRETLFVEDYGVAGRDARFRATGLRAIAFAPLMDGAGQPMIVLLPCSFSSPRPWTHEERALLANATRALGGVFERVRLTQQLHELLAIARRLTQAEDPEHLYADVTEAAVRVIPGADAASIMIRKDDGYRFVASVGHDLDMLAAMPPLSHGAQVAWHGLGVRAFEQGTPRVLRGAEIAMVSLSTGSDDPQQRHALSVGGRVADIRANLCVPVTDGSEVVGILNVDSLSSTDAFGPSSLRLAEAFAQQAGVIIRQAVYRRALERSAVTDPVTKLGNREGFNQRLQSELARADRHAHRVSVVMLDLNGFKDVNDRLGHQAGDRALLLVADAMRRERRPFDGLFRWGGDEFAVILPEVGPDGAGAGAQRYADAIAQVEVGGMRMTTSFGTASYPEDGENADSLLRRADDLMYHHKDLVRELRER